jgi:hypothetical protein
VTSPSDIHPTGSSRISEVRVRYARGWAIAMIVMSAFLLAMFPFVRTWTTSLVGGVNLVVGILMLTRPLYVLSTGVLEVKNLLGMTIRRIPFASFSEFEIDGDGKIWHTARGGQKKRIRISRFMVDGGDYRRFTDTLATRAFE